MEEPAADRRDVPEFLRAGLGEEDQARLQEHLRAAGAGEEEIQEALLTGTLGVLALDLALRPPGALVPFADAAAAAGISTDDATALWRALGFAVPADGSLLLTSEEAAMMTALVGLSRQVIGEGRGLNFARVIGWAAAVLAEALVDSFRVQVEMPRLSAGERYADIVEDYTELARAAFPTFVQGIGIITRGHMLRVARAAWTTDEEQSAVTREQVIGFVDLVGYTGHSRALSTTDLASAIGRFESVVADLVARFGGRLVKFIGDEAMFAVDDPEAACELALELARAFDADPALPPVRAGLASGPVVALHGDYYGDVVNLAARLVRLAEPSQVVVSGPLREALAGRFAADELAAQEVKGFDGPVRAFRVAART